jgi:protocatechuate 3,4-dioxygenase beta subunit
MGLTSRMAGHGLFITRMTCAVGLISLCVAARSASGEDAGYSMRGKRAREKPTRGVVSGRVLTPEGRPVKGASVSWVSTIDREATMQATVTTDDAGHFVFSNAAQLRRKDPSPAVMVEAAGWGLSFQQIPQEDDVLELFLSPATELRVSFVDPEGKPASGLSVRPVFLAGGLNALLLIPRTVADRFGRRTNGEGSVTIAGLPQDHLLRLAITDERFAQLNSNELIHLDTGPVTQAELIHLLPEASIGGRVTFGSTGKPAAGIRVGAVSGGSGGWGEAVTDPEGRYVVTQLRPGAYNIALDLQGEIAKSWTARAHELVPVAAGERLDGRDFTLLPGAVITGKVTAADNGEPIPGVWIHVYGPAHPRSGLWPQSVPTGPDGTYIHRVAPGRQSLYLGTSSRPGLIPPAQTARDLTVQDGETVMINFAVGREAPVKPVRGRVLGPDGRPVAGAEVVVFVIGLSGRTSWPLRADAEGRFRLSRRLLIQPLGLRARHQGMGTTSGTVVTGGENVTLRLEKDALVRVSGRVTDAQGKPLVGAPVHLIQWAYDEATDGATTRTDDQGRYAFSGLWPDLQYTVAATAAGYGDAESRRVQLGPGQSEALDPIVLRQTDR